jgi:hypothetical protein
MGMMPRSTVAKAARSTTQDCRPHAWFSYEYRGVPVANNDHYNTSTITGTKTELRMQRVRRS